MGNDETDLDRLLRVAEAHARMVLVTMGQDELNPLFHLRCPGTHDLILEARFSGAQSKDEAAQMISEMIRQTHATAYMFLSEAWMIVRQAGYEYGSPRPAEADDRVEVVVALATDGADYRTRRWRIKRHEGRCIDLVADEESDERPTRTGRFDNLFTRH